MDGDSYLWLLKPTGLNRGRGVHVFNSLQMLEKLLIEYYDGFYEKDLGKQTKAKIENNE